MIVAIAAGFATVCAASFFLPLDRTLRLGIFASGTSALALYVAGRSPPDTGRMTALVAVLGATFIACAAGHTELSIRGGGARAPVPATGPGNLEALAPPRGSAQGGHGRTVRPD